MPLAVVTGVVMLVGWFPLGALIHQQGQLAAARTQINALHQQQQALVQQSQSLDSASAATQLAREQYQLVSPGQSLIQVLPGIGSGYVAQSSGDPGFQPLVSPSSAPSLIGAPSPATAVSTGHSSNGFFARFVRTLEFWR